MISHKKKKVATLQILQSVHMLQVYWLKNFMSKSSIKQKHYYCQSYIDSFERLIGSS